MEVTSSVSLLPLSPHAATLVSHWGQVQSVLQPLSCLDWGSSCSMFFKPQTGFFMALNVKWEISSL